MYAYGNLKKAPLLRLNANFLGNKKEILKSDKTTGFYIKVYNNRAKAFFMDKTNNLINYI